MAKKKASGGAPEWMVTYGDMMSLLLCFFVMLVAMSTIDKEQFVQAVQSIQEALGYDSNYGQIPSMESTHNSMLQRLEMIVLPKQVKSVGETEEDGLEGNEYRVEQVREGLRITGGVLEFDRGSAEARSSAASVMEQLTEELRGHTTKIEIRGHTSLEPLPEGCKYADQMDLSYARAKSIAALLVNSGIKPERIRVVACGSSEPVRTQAYQEKQRARNRRVEVLVTEALVSDLVGEGTDNSEEP